VFFNSFIYLIFLALVLTGFYLLRGHRTRTGWLVLASYLFYGYWDWRFCGLLAMSTLVDFFVGRAMGGTDDQRRRKRLLLISCAVNLGVLGFFKYYNFFVDSIIEGVARFGGNVDFLHLHIILPVGISFYTFQTMSYTVDVYRKKIQPTDSLLEFALFVAFFPQLVAGPIERAANILPQLKALPTPSRKQIEEGLWLMVNGYARKVLLGDTAGRYVDHIYGHDQLYHSPELLAAAILFAVQVYGDFSGYSNIARGTARLLGINLMRNFEQPHFSTSLAEYWRRWHISLSSWLRDYLYIGLGGNRHGGVRTYANVLVTMLLGGLWHGAGWTFVAWGLLHAVLLMSERYIWRNKKRSFRFQYTGWRSVARFAVGLLYANFFIVLTRVLFRSEDFGQAWRIFSSFVNWEGSELAGRFAVIVFTYIAAVLVLDVPEYYTRDHCWLLHRSRPVAAGVATVVMGVVFLYMATAVPMPFVYFQF